MKFCQMDRIGIGCVTPIPYVRNSETRMQNGHYRYPSPALGLVGKLASSSCKVVCLHIDYQLRILFPTFPVVPVRFFATKKVIIGFRCGFHFNESLLFSIKSKMDTSCHQKRQMEAIPIIFPLPSSQFLVKKL